MAGDHDGDLSFIPEPHQRLTHFDNALGIQTVDGFVEHEHFRIAHQGQTDAQTLAHTEGEGARTLFPIHILETDGLQQLFDITLRLDAHTETFDLQVVVGRETGIEAGALDEHADVFQLFAHGVARFSEEGITSLRGGGKAADHPHDGRFSGAVAPDQAVDHAFRDVKADIVDGGFLAVDLGQPLGFQNVFHVPLLPKFFPMKPYQPLIRTICAGWHLPYIVYLSA